MTTATTDPTVEQNGAIDAKAKGEGDLRSSTVDGPSFGKPIKVAIADIRDDPTISVRFGKPEPSKVEQYKEDMESGREFPPIKLARYPDGSLYLIGGVHRRQAALAAGFRDILAQVAVTTPERAFLAAIEDNRKHGVPLSLNDKGHIIARLLGDPERFGELSDRQIAEMVGVSPTTVGLFRKQIAAGRSVDDINAERTERKKKTAAKAAKTRRAKSGRVEAEDGEAEDAAPAGDDSRDDADWSDQKYFAERVNPKLSDPESGLNGARLKALKAEVSRWRKVKAARESFQTDLVKAGVKGAVEAGTAGQWESEIYFALLQAGPNRWLVCGACQGKGGDCCRNRGYVVPKSRARK